LWPHANTTARDAAFGRPSARRAATTVTPRSGR
jgi:hypothetical protein